MRDFTDLEFENANRSDLLKFKCELCGKVFYKTKGQFSKNGKRDYRFCSFSCKNKGAYKRIEIKCSNCGKTIEKTPCQIKNSKSGYVFCSSSCSASLTNTLKIKSEESKIKVAKTLSKYYEIRKNKFLIDLDDKTIEDIEKYVKENKTFNEIKNLVDITVDKLTKLIKILKNENVVIPVDKLEVIKFYTEKKSIRLTSEHFNIGITLTKKILGKDLILEIKEIRKKNKVTKSQSVISWRNRKKEELVEYKGGKCEICGYDKCITALHFHHKDPNEKDFTVSRKSYSFERLKEEVDKCILVCANCHSEIHYELNKND